MSTVACQVRASTSPRRRLGARRPARGMCSSPLSRQKKCAAARCTSAMSQFAASAIPRAGTRRSRLMDAPRPGVPEELGQALVRPAWLIITRCMAIASLVLIRAKKARAIASSCSRSGVAGSAANRRCGSSCSHLVHRGGEQRFLVAEMAVDGELGDAGLGAIASMLTPSKPRAGNRGLAASRIAARFPCPWAGPGLAGLAGRAGTGWMGSCGRILN